MKTNINRQTDALIIVDVQRDFLPGGTLAVPQGDRIIPVINALMPQFDRVILTQDWHPADHISFVQSQTSVAVLSGRDGTDSVQKTWPIHCVAGTPGAEFPETLDLTRVGAIIRKGVHRQRESYSAFLEQDRVTRTGLDGYLRALNVSRVFVCGLALDFCVTWTAVDATTFGFETIVLEDASAAIDVNGSLADAYQMMRDASIEFMCTHELMATSA